MPYCFLVTAVFSPPTFLSLILIRTSRVGGGLGRSRRWGLDRDTIVDQLWWMLVKAVTPFASSLRKLYTTILEFADATTNYIVRAGHNMKMGRTPVLSQILAFPPLSYSSGVQWLNAEEAACMSDAARLFFFPLPSADPVGKCIEYATKTQTEKKLGDTWLNNHHSTLICKREEASKQ